MQPPLVVILGAGQPFSGTEPSALRKTSGGRRVLDWLIDAFTSSLDSPEIHFVGGYRLEDIIDEYPDIHFSRNEDWGDTGTVGSLISAPLDDTRPTYVCYADIVFEPSVINRLETAANGVTVAVDTDWRTRYADRSPESKQRAEKVLLDGMAVERIASDIDPENADAEFVGLVRFSAEALNFALDLVDRGILDVADDLPALLTTLSVGDVTPHAIDIEGHWAELETGEDLSRFVLDTKANTLRRLQSMVEESTILDQHTFTVCEWQTDPDAVRAAIADAFDESKIIVRSSALAEDTWNESNAGRFESVLDVPADDTQSVTDAIEQVIGSYADANPDNQVLVQPMISDVDQSGVVMTRVLEGFGPYYVINYDATTESTESVTDGTGEHLRTAIVRKDAVTTALDVPKDISTQSVQSPSGISLNPLLRAVSELEEIIGHDSLDVEFTIDSNDTVHVLQARPMAVDPVQESIDDESLYKTVDAAREEFNQAQYPSPFLLGNRTIYGVMPDWNPAEIIGRRPRRLAASLYQYLIMNETWAEQRAEYGYRDVRPHPLMKQFAGQPYVDVRADFNSFIPASVPDDLAERLVTYYLDRLEENPQLHDKVEFDIVLTCLTFDYERQIEPLLEAGFNRGELEPLREGLWEITREAFDCLDDDYATIAQLAARHEQILDSELPPLRMAHYLLEDCCRLGTLPFAHLARTAFIATSLLRSLERKEILTDEQRSEFQNSLNTVTRQFERDSYHVATGELSWNEFVEKYGHLRPGTYEITSAAYREAPEEYLRPLVEDATAPPSNPDPRDVWDDGTKAAIEDELDRIGLPANVESFIQFLVDAIEGREYAKFVFSRNLSEALERIAEFGDQHGFSREELSHIPIKEFFELAVKHSPTDIERWLADRVREGREANAMTQSVELPPLLFEEQDFVLFERPAREPNFVTNETVTAEGVELDGDAELCDINGKIVLIPQADPGYDWLFGHDIAGLVTMYGGSNSHMAVRAAEFSLPAAIGVGENRYDQLRRADVLELNCGGLYTKVVQ